jgi:hypothetical protein
MSENEITSKMGSIYPVIPPPLWSSLELGWKGLVVERYSAPPCEFPDLPTVAVAGRSLPGVMDEGGRSRGDCGILFFAVNPWMTRLAAPLLQAIASRVHGRFAPILLATEPFLFVRNGRR